MFLIKKQMGSFCTLPLIKDTGVNKTVYAVLCDADIL